MARRSYVGRPPAPAIPRAPSGMSIREHIHGRHLAPGRRSGKAREVGRVADRHASTEPGSLARLRSGPRPVA